MTNRVRLTLTHVMSWAICHVRVATIAAGTF